MAEDKESAAGPSGPHIDLSNGQYLRLRPITAEDKPRLQDHFYRLSPHSRFLRFHYTRGHITEKELDYFTHMEPPRSVAFAATLGEGAAERFVAIGRWHPDAEGEAADIAFAVEDIYQHQGIGTAMIKYLAEAARGYGIKRLTASVLLENSLMLQALEESGLRITRQVEDETYIITLLLD